MSFRKFNLFLLGILMVVLYFSIPVYNTWLSAKIFCETCSIPVQSRIMGLEERMAIRFGGPYNASKSMQKSMEDSKMKDLVLLLPPNSYIHAMNVTENVDMPEPAVFYYFTGIKAVWATSPQRDLANWALIASEHRLWLKPVNKESRDSLIALYKKYPNTN